jgi:hypothetical protein
LINTLREQAKEVAAARHVLRIERTSVEDHKQNFRGDPAHQGEQHLPEVAEPPPKGAQFSDTGQKRYIETPRH